MCGGAILSDLYSPVRRKVTADDLWTESGSSKSGKNWKRKSSWEFGEDDNDDFEADFEGFEDGDNEEDGENCMALFSDPLVFAASLFCS